MQDDKAAKDLAQIASLSRQLGDIDAKLQALISEDADAIIGPDGSSFLLRQAQTRLLQSEEELRELAQKLEQERAKLVAAQAVAKIGSWSIDATSRAVDWSEEMYRICEMSPDMLHFDRLADLVHPEDRDQVMRQLQASFLEDESQVMEHRLLAAGGTMKFVEARWQIERDADGTAIRAFGTCQDITARQQVESALRQSEAQLSMAMRLSRIGAWSVNLNSSVVWWSDEVCAMHEVEPGTSPSLDEAVEFFAAEWRPLLQEAVLECMENGTPYDLELEMLSARGRRLWVRTIGEAIRDSNGRVVRIQGAVHDLSDRKRAENEVRRLAKRLTAILESLNVGFFSVDHHWQITYFNNESERIFGRHRDDVLGQVLWHALPQLVDTEFENSLRQAAATGAAGFSEAKLRFSELWFLATVNPSEEGVAVFMRDVTVEHAASLQLRQLNLDLENRVRTRTAELDAAREQAESASRAKSSFLAAMSHEIRTPMNGIIGLVDVLSHSSLLPSQAEMVRLVRDSAESLLSIIDDILDFSKIEAGKLQIERAPIRLHEIVEKVGVLLASVARRRQVALTVFIDPDIPETVLGDELRLRQILINLLGNAIKFSSGLDRSGRVSVRVTLVERVSQSFNVELTVSDNGVGIDAKTLESLFQPFSQADASTTRRFGGTGLGLAITKMLVDLQGGAISVESSLGAGATFSVKLPLESVPGSGSTSVEPSLRGLQCLILGAEEQLAADLSKYLSHAGAQAERLQKGAEISSDVRELDTVIWLILPDASELERQSLRTLATIGSPSRFITFRFGDETASAIDVRLGVSVDLETLTRASLLRCVAAAAGRAPVAARDTESLRVAERLQPLAVQGSWLEGVLVAEDTETNREVILRQLKLLGLDAEMTVNGQQALERWRSGKFNLVLTDVRMPIMDGYALARAIRAEEKEGRRSIVIALTADAMPEEERKCFAAGMDGYLVKPVTSARLKAIIEGQFARRLATENAPISADSASAVNLEVLKSLIGDDPAGIAAVLEKFRMNSGLLSDELARAIGSDQFAAAGNIAHKLKSGAASIGARRLSEICVDIEHAASGTRRDQLEALLPQFRAQMHAVQLFLESATV